MNARARARPAVLVASAVEPLGRAGLLVDLETLAAHRVRAIAVPTASTAQVKNAARVEPLSRQLVQLQIAIALEEAPPAAVKLGVVPNGELLRGISHALPKDVPWVVDPVVRSSARASLSSAERDDYLLLARPNVVLTPNLDELAWLSGRTGLDAEDDRLAAAKALVDRGFGAVVVKGGHAVGEAVDLLVTETKATRLPGRRLRRGAEVRGTGCRFASALAAGLARGWPPLRAARAAKLYVAEQIAKAR